MGRKFMIKDQGQKMSDREIMSYMDFDSLLKKRNEMVIKQGAGTPTSLVRWIAGGSSVLVIGLLSVIYFSEKNRFEITPGESGEDVSLTIPGRNDLSPDTGEEHAVVDSSARAIDPKIPEVIAIPVEKNHIETSEEIDKGKKEKENQDKSSLSLTTENVYSQAEPRGGYPALYDYFEKQLSYPLAALKDSVEGVVIVTFVIERDGHPTKIKIDQSLGEAFDREAVRLIEVMPGWEPARLGNEAVPSKVSIPITFTITKQKKNAQNE